MLNKWIGSLTWSFCFYRSPPAGSSFNGVDGWFVVRHCHLGVCIGFLWFCFCVFFYFVSVPGSCSKKLVFFAFSSQLFFPLCLFFEICFQTEKLILHIKCFPFSPKIDVCPDIISIMVTEKLLATASSGSLKPFWLSRNFINTNNRIQSTKAVLFSWIPLVSMWSRCHNIMN